VRCLEHDIPRVLDIGACGVQIPMVQSPEHAAALVRRVRYPLPGGRGGQRGSAFSTRAAGFGAFGGPAHTKLSNEGLALVAMIETPEAARQARAIAAVDGVDGIFIGPADLHASFGFVGEKHHPDVWPRIEDAVRRIRAAGKAPGFLTPSEEDSRRILELGGQFVAVGSDAGLLAKAADALCARFREPRG